MHSRNKVCVSFLLLLTTQKAFLESGLSPPAFNGYIMPITPQKPKDRFSLLSLGLAGFGIGNGRFIVRRCRHCARRFTSCHSVGNRAKEKEGGANDKKGDSCRRHDMENASGERV